MAVTPSVLGAPGPIAGAGLVPLLGLAGAYLFGRKRLAADANHLDVSGRLRAAFSFVLAMEVGWADARANQTFV